MTNIGKKRISFTALMGVAILLSMVFASCKNFMTASQIKDEIQAVIEKNNAKDIVVQIDNKNMGIVTPNGSVTRKLGYEFEVQFRPDTDNYYIKDADDIFEAVSLYDESKDFNEYVKFKTLEQKDDDKANGIYRVEVKVLEDIKGILIRPRCTEIPKVVEVFPATANIDYRQDISLEITFNKAINLEDFTYENGYLKNIQIVSNGENLLDSSNGKLPYYSDPYLKNDGKVLVIPAAKGNYIIKEGDSKKIKDIEAIINFEGLSDQEGIAFKDKNFNFAYRINDTKDQTDPQNVNFDFAKKQEDLLSGQNLISYKDIELYNQFTDMGATSGRYSTFIKQRHVGCVWFHVQADDDFSGIDYVEVQEKLLYYRNGLQAEDPKVYTKYTNPDTNIFANEKGSISMDAYLKYEFAGLDDGVVRLTFIVADRAGNTVEKTLDFIKDTECEISVTPHNIETREYKNSNIYTSDNPDEYDYVIPLMPSMHDSVYLTLTSSDGDEYKDRMVAKNVSGSGNNEHYDYDTRLVDFSYGYSKNQMQSAELSAETYMWQGNLTEGESTFTYGSEQWYVDKSLKLFPKIKVDPKRTIYTKATLQDDAGNLKVCEAEIIPANYIATAEYIDRDPNTRHINFASHHYCPGDALYCVYEDSDGTKNKAYKLKDFETCKTQVYKSDMKYYSGDSLKSGKDFTELDNGKYYFYVISSSGNFVTCGIKPFILYKNANGISTSNADSMEIPSSAVPTVSQFTVTPGTEVKSTALTPIHIEFTNGFTPDPRFNYRVEFEASSTEGDGCGKSGSFDSYNSETKSFDFNVQSTYHPSVNKYYEFWIVVYNDKFIESSPIKKVTMKSENIPPKLKLRLVDAYSWIKPTEIAIKDSFFVSTLYPRPGLKSNNPPKYFYSDNPNLLGTVNWQSDSFVKNAEYNSNIWMYPMDGGPYKYLYAYYKDYYENTVEERFRLYVSYVDAKAKIESFSTTYKPYNAVSSQILNTIKVSYPKPSGNNIVFCAKIEKLTTENEWDDYRTDNWITEKRDANCINYTPNGDNYELILKPSYSDTNLTSYVRIYTWYGKDFSGGVEAGYYDTLYVYVPGKITPADYSCKHKDILYGVRGLQIYTDKPVMVHTLESSKDYGNNIQEWLNYGSEVKIETDSEGFLYKEPVEKVTAGKYYTTIAHFADGDMEMTPVAQKGY